MTRLTSVALACYTHCYVEPVSAVLSCTFSNLAFLSALALARRNSDALLYSVFRYRLQGISSALCEVNYNDIHCLACYKPTLIDLRNCSDFYCVLSTDCCFIERVCVLSLLPHSMLTLSLRCVRVIVLFIFTYSTTCLSILSYCLHPY